jgi:hypothetical protein
MKESVSGRWWILSAALLLGCESSASAPHSSTQPDLFAPTAMRVHPIFTQVSDWTHSGKPDGVEAQLEFTDQFGDPTKASGKVLFELFDFRRESPDPRAKRLGHWVGSLATPDEQKERWNTTLRTYRFQLDYPQLDPAHTYVLCATFELTTGGRFFDQIVLPGHPAEKTDKKKGTGLGVE